MKKIDISVFDEPKRLNNTDKLVVESSSYSIVCKAVSFYHKKGNSSSSRITINIEDYSNIILPANVDITKYEISTDNIPFYKVRSIYPLESNRQLLVELEYEKNAFEIICSSIDYFVYSHCYIKPVFVSPLLGEQCKDKFYSTSYPFPKNSRDHRKVYPIASPPKIKRVSILRNKNEIPFFEGIINHIVEEERFHNRFNDSVIYDNMMDYKLCIDDKELCIWGLIYKTINLGETWKKGPTGNYILGHPGIFFCKAFPTRYSFNLFLKLLDEEYSGQNEEVPKFLKLSYFKSDYYYKKVKCPLMIKDFIDKYDFSSFVIGYSY